MSSFNAQNMNGDTNLNLRFLETQCISASNSAKQ